MSQGERNALVVFVGKIAGAAVSVAYVVIVPRVLGPESYGFYAFWYAQLFLLYVLFDLGTTETLKRYLPAMLASGDGQARTLVAGVRTAKLAVIPAACLLALGYEQPLTYLAIVAAAVCATYSWIHSDVSFAANRMGWYTAQYLLRKVVRLALLLALFVAFGDPGIVAALLLSEAVLLALAWTTTRGVVPAAGRPLVVPFRRYLWFGFLVYAATLVYFALGRAPVIVAESAGLPFAEIGYLALALDITFFALRELFYGIGEALQPVQAVDYAEGRHEKLARSLHTARRYTLIVMLPALSIIAIHAEPLLSIIGRDYLPALPCLLVLLPVGALGVLGYLYRQALIVAERKGAVLAASGGAVAVFALVVSVQPEISALSLARAVLAGTLAHCIAGWWAARPVLRAAPEPLSMLPRIGIAALAFHGLAWLYPGPDPVLAVPALAGAGAAYLALLAALRIVGHEEVELLGRIARRWGERG